MCVQSFGTLGFSNLAGPLVMFTVGNGNMMEHVIVPYSAQQLLYPKNRRFLRRQGADPAEPIAQSAQSARLRKVPWWVTYRKWWVIAAFSCTYLLCLAVPQLNSVHILLSLLVFKECWCPQCPPCPLHTC
jgi:hypothetical protein